MQHQQPSSSNLFAGMQAAPAQQPVMFGATGMSAMAGQQPVRVAPAQFPSAASTGSSMDFNPRGGSMMALPQQQPIMAAAPQPSGFGGSAFGGGSVGMLQPQQQHQSQTDFANFGSFQSAQTPQVNPNDVLSSNQHLYNLDQLSAPSHGRGGPAGYTEPKKTLAQIAAEKQQPQRQVLSSAPTTTTGVPLGSQQMTLQQQQMYLQQQQLLLQQQMQMQAQQTPQFGGGGGSMQYGGGNPSTTPYGGGGTTGWM